jgi:hypothetical protein
MGYSPEKLEKLRCATARAWVVDPTSQTARWSSYFPQLAPSGEWFGQHQYW